MGSDFALVYYFDFLAHRVLGCDCVIALRASKGRTYCGAGIRDRHVKISSILGIFNRALVDITLIRVFLLES